MIRKRHRLPIVFDLEKILKMEQLEQLEHLKHIGQLDHLDQLELLDDPLMDAEDSFEEIKNLLSGLLKLG